MASQARHPGASAYLDPSRSRCVFSYRWLLVTLCAAAGLALSAALFFLLFQREIRLAEARFHLDAERQADRIQRAVDHVIASVRVLGGFFAGSELVEPDEFRIFTKPLAKATPSVLLFGWAPVARGDDGKESFDVLYLSGEDLLPVEVGWNLAAVPECRAALSEARESGMIVASAPFSLDGSGPPMILLAAAKENDRREGAIFALFVPDDLVRSVLGHYPSRAMSLHILDFQETDKPTPLAEHDVGDEQPDEWFRIGAFAFEPFSHRLEVGGREWLIECRPTAALVAARRGWLPWIAAMAGVLLTVAGVTILVMLAVQTSRVERLVAARTAEVKESEERLRTITDTALDAVVMMEPDGSVAYWNPAAEQMFGYGRSEVLGRDVHEMLAPDEYRERTALGLRRFAETGEGNLLGRLLELEAVRKDGTRFPIEISVAPIHVDGGWGAVAIVRDITQRRAAEAALRKEQALLRQLLEFEERERKLMAYEIHDGLVQQITGAHLTLQSLPQVLTGDDASARGRLEAADGLLREAVAEARRIISGLRPPILDESGIEPAVAHLIEQQKRRGPPQIELVSELKDRRFTPLVETAIFRIVQEALNNACRYSHSDRVRVELRCEEDRLHVEVRDWGQGFDPARVGADHFGLQGIQERARLLEGSAEVHSVPGQGTTIRVTLPTRFSSNGIQGECDQPDESA